MIWPFRKKNKNPQYAPDELIASLIAGSPMKYVEGTDHFITGKTAWTMTPDYVKREDGLSIKASPTARMFLAAHLNQCPRHQVH